MEKQFFLHRSKEQVWLTSDRGIEEYESQVNANGFHRGTRTHPRSN